LRPRSFFSRAGWTMTHQVDAARSREISARWCALAEQRLEYLTELFETGRWRRFHSERGVLENIQEAKAAVQLWRDLSSDDPSRDSSVIERSWIARANGALPHGHALPREAKSLVPELAGRSETDANSDIRPSMKSIADRYPLLRNAL
jgi:hypothetical protein